MSTTGIGTTHPAEYTRDLRDQLIGMGFAFWILIGLYIDGWSHQANKPETFFTPWHAVLYSGFAAGALFFTYNGRRDRRRGLAAASPIDRTAQLGGAVFVLGGVGDGIWHEVAGVEADIEALISPTHLTLMIGGLLMLSLPLRAALQSVNGRTLPARGKAVVAASMALLLSLVMFFLMYLSLWTEHANYLTRYIPDEELPTYAVEVGMATMLITTTLFCGALLWLAARWKLAFGTATAMFTVVALGQSGLEGFDVRLPVLAATAAGLVADVLLRQGRSLRIVGAAAGLVLAGSYFGLLHIEEGVAWGPSLWVGAVVFAAMAGYGTGVAVDVTRPRP